MWYTYTVEYYSATIKKKDEMMLFAATWMDLEIVIVSKLSQVERYKYIMIPLICGILKKRYK